MNIDYQITGNGQLVNFGTIGYLTSSCFLGSFNNLVIRFMSLQKLNYDDSEINIAGLVGCSKAQQVTINDSNLQGNIGAASNVALVCGIQTNTDFIINNIIISESNITGKSVQTQSICGGIFGHINGSAMNQYNNIKLSVFVQSSVQNNNQQFTSSLIGYSSLLGNLNITNCNISETTIFSQSFASGAISFIFTSNISCQDILIINSNIQSVDKSVTASGGLFAQIDNCILTCKNIIVTQSNIYSDSGVPRASGIISISLKSTINILNSKIVNSTIRGYDSQQFGPMKIYTGQVSGVMAQSSSSSIIISDLKISDSNLSITCRQHSVSGGIQGELRSVNSKITNVKLYNNIIISISLNLNSHIGGINSVTSSGTTDYQQNVLLQYNYMHSQAYAGNSHTGGLDGWVQNTNISVYNAKILQFNQIVGGKSSGCGGFIGAVSISQVNIMSSSITDSNITANVTDNSVIGTGIGLLDDTKIAIFDNIVFKNIIHNLNGSNAYSGVFVALLRSTNKQNITLTQIRNSLIDSVQIQSQAAYNNLKFILYSQYPELEVGVILISSTKSIGFSNVKGIVVNNCDNVQVQQINGNNSISNNGCI
ncbi:Hypothetical_protein [Hexamita inflata]|uniref:Hypothetical_protein n=1 Tax=Hexamita inflata TaxID=28002 RepID=A0AA86U8D4_9EUKA|nr:Hypothetical protein HINF_LOCUS34830 [Hexamita inflata]